MPLLSMIPFHTSNSNSVRYIISAVSHMTVLIYVDLSDSVLRLSRLQPSLTTATQLSIATLFVSTNLLFNYTSPLTAPPLLTSRDVGFKFQPTQLHRHSKGLCRRLSGWSEVLVLIVLPSLLPRLKVNPHVSYIWRLLEHC
jgi:hypothetical protein